MVDVSTNRTDAPLGAALMQAAYKLGVETVRRYHRLEVRTPDDAAAVPGAAHQAAHDGSPADAATGRRVRAGVIGDRVEDAMQGELSAMTAGRRPVIG